MSQARAERGVDPTLSLPALSPCNQTWEEGLPGTDSQPPCHGHQSLPFEAPVQGPNEDPTWPHGPRHPSPPDI